ncbi:MAG: phosphatase PAP2 family protein [Planctomycetota bacterium]
MRLIQQIKSIIISVLLISFSTFIGCQTAPHARLSDYPKPVAHDTADTKPTPAKPQSRRSGINSVPPAPTNVGNYFGAKRDYTDVQYLGAAVGSTAVLTLVDRPVRRYVTSSSNNTMNVMTDVAMTFGDKNAVIYISLGAAGAANHAGNYYLADTSFLVAEAAFLANKASNGLKCLNRNYQSQPNLKPSEGTNKYPYTSNHTVTAFAGASVIASRTESPTVAIMSYSTAGLVAFARVYRDDHWLSDVWVSALIGTAIGTAIAELDQTPKNNIFLGPITNENFLGIGIKTEF